MERNIPESSERNKAVIENVVDFIISINAKGFIQCLNPASEKMSGF